MKIAFCGDLVLRSPKNHTLGSRLRSILSGADIRVLNFEVPIEVKNCKGIHKSGPVHSQSTDSPHWVINNGFNMITLANNHSLDYGEAGLKATIKAFGDVKITGTGTFDTAYETTIFEQEGQKIGFLGLTHKEFGCVDEYSGNILGTAMVTSPKVYSSIAKSKQRVDKLFVLPHAGVEYTEVPLPEWREIYKSYIDLGADGVIASHPHVPQGWETYKGCPIFYSLGNFLFEVPNPNLRPPKWLNSIMVVIDTSVNEFEVFPLYYDYKKKTVEVDDTRESGDYLLHLCELLSTDKYLEMVHLTLEDLADRYKVMMISGGAYALGLKEKIKNLIRPFIGKKRRITDSVHLLNLFQCESHRWIMMRLLQKEVENNYHNGKRK